MKAATKQGTWDGHLPKFRGAVAGVHARLGRVIPRCGKNAKKLRIFPGKKRGLRVAAQYRAREVAKD